MTSEVEFEPLPGLGQEPVQGFYPAIDYAEYHAWPYASSTRIKLFDSTPLEARYALLHPPEPTDAFARGGALHHLLLEGPEVFASQFLIAPKVDRRTREGKAVWKEFEVEAAGRTLLLETEHVRVRGMLEALWTCETARNILVGVGLNEVSHLWSENGVWCKARTDLLRKEGPYPIIWDVKTTKAPTRDGFAREIANFRYHIQAGFYTLGAERVYGQEHRFGFLVVCPQPPHLVAVYELEAEEIQAGRKRALELLAVWRECERTGIWPGLPDHVQMIGRPLWARKGQDSVYA